jgi:hypothetical protein
MAYKYIWNTCSDVAWWDIKTIFMAIATLVSLRKKISYDTCTGLSLVPRPYPLGGKGYGELWPNPQLILVILWRAPIRPRKRLDLIGLLYGCVCT